MLREFHERHAFAVNSKLAAESDGDVTERLVCAAYSTRIMARDFEVKAGVTGSLRLLRAHLMMEELSEAMQALADCDELQLLDALCDLAYVVEGTGVAYGLPMEAAFAEVHRSNMTKAVRKAGDVRLRDKGRGYVPPDLARVLREPR